MATTDLPGTNPINNDKLGIGCWAEHEDGSLVFVKGIDENEVVIFEIYDLTDADRPVFYQQALSQTDFEKTFSYDNKKKDKSKKDKTINIKWIWHDKSIFPWDRVMKSISRPVPAFVNVEDTISAAKRLAESLKARAVALTEDHVLNNQGMTSRKGGRTSKTIMDRLKNAMAELVG